MSAQHALNIQTQLEIGNISSALVSHNKCHLYTCAQSY